MSEYWLRKAEPFDVRRIYEFSKEYLLESLQGKKFELDENTALETFNIAVQVPDMYETYIAESDKGLLGVMILLFSSSFFKGEECDVEFFYVAQNARGTGVSRALVEKCVEIKKDRGLNIIYAGCHSSFDDSGKNDKMFKNLFMKYGFEVTGTNLHLA